MPDFEKFEYVFAAYGIWIALFAVYLARLYFKSRRLTITLQKLPEKGRPGNRTQL